jgi:hypothetical protein
VDVCVDVGVVVCIGEAAGVGGRRRGRAETLVSAVLPWALNTVLCVMSCVP